jgi:DnaJ-class molecular chaperone
MAKAEFIDFYALLEIPVGADRQHIRLAFMRLAKRHHPDVGGSTATMQSLNVAYRTLIDPTAKAAYDLVHSFHSGITKPSDYSYAEGRRVHDLNDMSDDEIDSFLDTVLNEYSRPKDKESFVDRLKHIFATP